MTGASRFAPDVREPPAALKRQRGEVPEYLANEALRVWLDREL